eukprot:526986-Rhodomonas_salina.1
MRPLCGVRYSGRACCYEEVWSTGNGYAATAGTERGYGGTHWLHDVQQRGMVALFGTEVGWVYLYQAERDDVTKKDGLTDFYSNMLRGKNK